MSTTRDETLAEVVALFEARSQSRLDGGIMTAADAAELVRRIAPGAGAEPEQAEAGKDTREGESTQPAPGTCGRALSTGQPCPDHPAPAPTTAEAASLRLAELEANSVRLAAIDRLVGGRPGYDRVSVKAILSAGIDADGESAQFFQLGRTYTDDNGYRAPELTRIFRVEHVTRHPERGHLRAIGWMRTGSPGATWHGDFQDDAEGWTEIAEAGEPRG